MSDAALADAAATYKDAQKAADDAAFWASL